MTGKGEADPGTPPERILSASILAADAAHLAEAVSNAQEAGVDWVHVDVMDGHFVPNLTMGPQVVSALREACGLPLDVHLMIERPEDYLEPFAEAGASWITVHAEACVHLHRVVQRIRELGPHPSVALNPATSLEELRHVLAELDMVLLMTVNPGFSGQELIPAVLPKIRELRRWIDASDRQVLLQVDGGVHVDTVRSVVDAGADVLVAGSAIYNNRRVGDNVRRLREAAWAD